MEEKYMDKLYELLEKAEKEKDLEVIAVLRWVILTWKIDRGVGLCAIRMKFKRKMLINCRGNLKKIIFLCL